MAIMRGMGSIGSFLVRAIRLHKERAAARDLLRLTDNTLADIGLTREGVLRALRSSEPQRVLVETRRRLRSSSGTVIQQSRGP
jgi:uncharacterized protein YjiS (DUF1127 family)